MVRGGEKGRGRVKAGGKGGGLSVGKKRVKVGNMGGRVRGGEEKGGRARRGGKREGLRVRKKGVGLEVGKRGGEGSKVEG